MAKKTLAEKVEEIAPELATAAESMDVPALRSAIADRALIYSASRDAEKADEALEQAKTEVKLLREPYAEDQKAALLVIAYLHKQLESRNG